MTLLLVEGFDDSNDPIDKGWIGFGEANQAGEGRFGTYGSGDMGNGQALGSPILDHTDPTIIVGASVRFETEVPDTTDNFITLYGDSGTVDHIQVYVVANTGALQVRRGTATTLGTTAAGLISANTAHYIELKVLIHDSTGTVDLYVDGVSRLSLTSQDTKDGGTNSYVDRVTFTGVSGNQMILDDIYIANGAGSLNNDVLGDVHVETLYPNAEGATIQWTPSTGTDNAALIDEPNTPNTTDYNSDSTPGNIDMFDMDALSDASLEVFGVQMNSYAAKDTTDTIQFRHRINSDSNIANGADNALNTAWLHFVEMFETDPDGGGQWTGAQLNAAEFGYETRS